MTRWRNSFRFQLLAAMGLLALMLVAALFFGLRAVNSAANNQAIVNLIGQQRTNALLIDTTFSRLEQPLSETERAGILQLIETLVANFDQGQQALRFGDATLGVVAIENSSAVALFEELDARWIMLRSLIEASLLEQDDPAASPYAAIHDPALTVYTFADRLARAISIVVQQETSLTQQIATTIGILSAFFVVVALFIINNLTRSVSSLASAADQLGQGDLTTRAAVGNVDEIARVGQAFNAMAEQVEQRLIETQAARHRAEQSDKVKSSFLASMSHELRTPLNAIINFTRYVAKGSQGPVTSEQKETLDEVIDSAKHLLNLINDVLDMSKIEAGSLKLFLEPSVELSALLQTALSSGRALVQDKDVIIESDISADLPTISADRQRLLQILLNIMSNACKFTQHGSVSVSARPHGDEVIFSIADTGPGIAPEDQEAVFTPFKQTDTGLRQGGGTGLGMPITQSLVQAHGGRIWIESTVGKGSTFFVAIPINRTDAPVPALTLQEA